MIRHAFLFIAILFASGPALAEGAHPLRFYNAELDAFTDAPGVASEIHISIEGTISRTTVTQYFLNNTNAWQEGIYTYPLPDNAAVDSLTMMIGNRRIIGFVHEKEQAKKIYEKAKQEGKAAGLVEQHRPNIFRTAVANIPPRSMIAIEIAYQNNVRLDDYIFSLRTPLAITPRYDEFGPEELLNFVSSANQPWAQEVAERIRLTSFEGGQNPVHLTVSLDPGFAVRDIKSASHRLVTDQTDGVYRLSLKDRIIPGEKDFLLSWKPAETGKTLSAFHYEELDGAVYSHILILPPQNIEDIDTPAPKRQVTYIIDTSGSMAGPSIRQAREALASALQDLNGDDYFNVIEFNSYHKKLFSTPLPASRENIQTAIRLVRELEADGGTRMLPALEEAFAEEEIENRLRQIVFITDGAIGYESKVAALIRNKAGNARFYAIGIGAAPNGHLMRAIATAGRGTFTFISDVGEVQEKLTTLFRKMKSPVVTDLEIIIPDGVQATIIPRKLPDLMAGEPVSIAMKTDRLVDMIDLKGMKGGKPWTLRTKITDPVPSHGISKIYARRKIQDLSFQDPQGVNEEIRKEITSLGIRHQIMSRYTSLVAVDEEIIRPRESVLVTKRHDPALPAGWQEGRLAPREASRLYGEMLEKTADDNARPQNMMKHKISLPQTASGYPAYILLGVLMMVMAAGLWRRQAHAG